MQTSKKNVLRKAMALFLALALVVPMLMPFTVRADDGWDGLVQMVQAWFPDCEVGADCDEDCAFAGITNEDGARIDAKANFIALVAFMELLGPLFPWFELYQSSGFGGTFEQYLWLFTLCDDGCGEINLECACDDDCKCVTEITGVMHICNDLQPRLLFTPTADRDWITANFANPGTILSGTYGAGSRDILVVNFTEPMDTAKSFGGTVTLGTGMSVTNRRWSIDRTMMILDIVWPASGPFANLRNLAIVPGGERLHTTFTIWGFYAEDYDGEWYLRTPDDEIEEADEDMWNAPTRFIARPFEFGGLPDSPDLYVVWVSPATQLATPNSASRLLRVTDGGITTSTCDQNWFIREGQEHPGAPMAPAPWTREPLDQYIAVHFSMPVHPTNPYQVAPGRFISPTIGVSEIEARNNASAPRAELAVNIPRIYYIEVTGTGATSRIVRGVCIPNNFATLLSGRTINGIAFPATINPILPAHLDQVAQLAAITGCTCFSARFDERHPLFGASTAYACTLFVNILDTRTPNPLEMRANTRYRVNVDGFSTQDRAEEARFGGSANPGPPGRNEDFASILLYDGLTFFQHTYWVGEGPAQELEVAQIWVSTTPDFIGDFARGESTLIYSNMQDDINPIFNVTDPEHWAYGRVTDVVGLINRHSGLDNTIAGNYLTVIYNRPVVADINSIDISRGPLATLTNGEGNNNWFGVPWSVFNTGGPLQHLYGNATNIGNATTEALTAAPRPEESWGGWLECTVASAQALQGFMDMGYSRAGRVGATSDDLDTTGRIRPLPGTLAPTATVYGLRTAEFAPFAIDRLTPVPAPRPGPYVTTPTPRYVAYNANQWDLSLFSHNNRVDYAAVFNMLGIATGNTSTETSTHRPYEEEFTLTIEGWICAFYWRENFENYRIGTVQVAGDNYDWDAVPRFGMNRISLENHTFYVEPDPQPFVLAWTVVSGTVNGVQLNAANVAANYFVPTQAQLTASPINWANFNVRTRVNDLLNDVRGAAVGNPGLENDIGANVVNNIARRRWQNGGVNRHRNIPHVDIGSAGLITPNQNVLVLVFNEVVQPAALAGGTIQVGGTSLLSLPGAMWEHRLLLCSNHFTPATAVNLGDRRFPVSVAIIDLNNLVVSPGNNFTVIGYPERVWFEAPWVVRTLPNTAAHIGAPGSPYRERVVGAVTAERLDFAVVERGPAINFFTAANAPMANTLTVPAVPFPVSTANELPAIHVRSNTTLAFEQSNVMNAPTTTIHATPTGPAIVPTWFNVSDAGTTTFVDGLPQRVLTINETGPRVAGTYIIRITPIGAPARDFTLTVNPVFTSVTRGGTLTPASILNVDEGADLAGNNLVINQLGFAIGTNFTITQSPNATSTPVANTWLNVGSGGGLQHITPVVTVGTAITLPLTSTLPGGVVPAYVPGGNNTVVLTVSTGTPAVSHTFTINVVPTAFGNFMRSIATNTQVNDAITDINSAIPGDIEEAIEIWVNAAAASQAAFNAVVGFKGVANDIATGADNLIAELIDVVGQGSGTFTEDAVLELAAWLTFNAIPAPTSPQGSWVFIELVELVRVALNTEASRTDDAAALRDWVLLPPVSGTLGTIGGAYELIPYTAADPIKDAVEDTIKLAEQLEILLDAIINFLN